MPQFPFQRQFKKGRREKHLAAGLLDDFFYLQSQIFESSGDFSCLFLGWSCSSDSIYQPEITWNNVANQYQILPGSSFLFFCQIESDLTVASPKSIHQEIFADLEGAIRCRFTNVLLRSCPLHPPSLQQTFQTSQLHLWNPVFFVIFKFSLNWCLCLLPSFFLFFSLQLPPSVLNEKSPSACPIESTLC